MNRKGIPEEGKPPVVFALVFSPGSFQFSLPEHQQVLYVLYFILERGVVLFCFGAGRKGEGGRENLRMFEAFCITSWTSLAGSWCLVCIICLDRENRE